MPHTEKLHTIEKFHSHRREHDQLRGDHRRSRRYTKPWTGSFNLRWEANTELFEYVCQQANYATELMVGELEKVDRTTQIIP